ncbi:hypothetical protein C8D97_102145 [Pleionea mediterranea]|uniref:Peptidase metallopeptidase domain-containing protein n=2 Tax=Pleionea mediterranea TaxID=523701 RepID=A0A316G1H8_9GAMM|nr:hypothetical protein C8D97_102145 [Pleionea mediterranea]
MRKLLFLIITACFLPLSAAVITPDKRWPNGSTLTVWFLDGTPDMQHIVKRAATTWSRFGNISFRFTRQKPDNGSHLRISFSRYDGTRFGAHSDIHDNTATMYLNSLASSHLSDDYKNRIALHELGHVLGFEHEYRHPHWPYGNHWLKQQQVSCQQRLSDEVSDAKSRCESVNRPLDAHTSWWFPYDDHSIMNYPTEAKWLEDRSHDLEPTLKLSALDKIAMAASYPFAHHQYIQSTSLPDSDSLLTNSISFINRCPYPVTVRFKATLSSQSNKLTSLYLTHLQQSDQYQLVSPSLHFKALTNNGLHQWSDDGDYLHYDISHWQGNHAQIPLYCSNS